MVSMSNLRVVRELTIRAAAQGVDETTTKLRTLGTTYDHVADQATAAGAATEASARRTLSVVTAYDRLQRSLDETYRAQQRYAQVEATVERARAQGIGSEQRHVEILSLAQDRYLGLGAAAEQGGAKVANSTKLANHEITMMSAQFMDLGTQIASGGGLFLPIIQQGGQLAGQLGDRGARGAIRALGEGLLSFVTNPVNLAVVGVAALGAGVGYLASKVSDIDSLDEAFKHHEETIRGLKEAYGAAAEGLDAYQKLSGSIARANAMTDISTLKAGVMSEARSAARTLYSTLEGTDELGGVEDRFAPITASVQQFAETIRQGKPDFEALRKTAAELYLANPGNSALQALYRDLMSLTDAGAKAQSALDPLLRTIGNLTDMSARVAPGLDALMSKLPAIGDKNAEATSKAADALDKYLATTRTMAGTPLDQALARETNSFSNLRTQIEGTHGASDALAKAQASFDQRATAIRSQYGSNGQKISSGGSPYEHTVERARERISDVQAEVASFGMGRDAAAGYRMEIDLLSSAQRKGVELTPAQREALHSLSEEYAAAARTLSMLNVQQELQFDRADVFMSEVERQIARSQRSAGVNADSEMGRYIDQTMRLTDALQGVGDAGHEAFSSIANDLKNGEGLGKSFGDALGKMGDRLFQSGVDGVWDNLWGSFGNATGLGKVLGLGGKRDGSSEASALFVTVSGGVGSMIGGAASAASGGGGGLFGGSGGLLGGAIIPGILHDGGRVGVDGYSDRVVSLDAYRHARRFHTGFASDEFPAILQEGERVLTGNMDQRTMRAMTGLTRAAGAAGAASPRAASDGASSSGPMSFHYAPTYQVQGYGKDIDDLKRQVVKNEAEFQTRVEVAVRKGRNSRKIG
ncbi:phage tail length tape measure family protein [Hansschlegelia quercus]|uniref:Bacteriophage tail tape measure N-terminal domain-containing protein n=1 Tax=Hansschlegelia quercus TaxID=2528245 RepID=A0A4Q9GRJ0_9HYPH|nr:phage tail length tape measure family protein [Hansschlegelia quercus]TBN54720.1 hypothetical protein EYR15_00690 [Hansschlegelia quercus]